MQGLHPAGGQEAAPPRGPRGRPPRRRSSPRPSSSPAARASTASWSCARHERPHPDRRARGRRPRRALRHRASRNARWSATSTSARCRTCCRRMEAAFVDIGRGRNAVLYAGEVNWDAAGLERPAQAHRARAEVRRHRARAGHQGPDRPQGRPAHQPDLAARPLPGLRARRLDDRHLPQAARHRAHPAQGHPASEVVPEDAGVIVRTAAEGATEEELRRDVERLQAQWERHRSEKAEGGHGAGRCSTASPTWPIKVVRDIFNEDFTALVVAGDERLGRRSTSYVERRRARPRRPARSAGPATEDVVRGATASTSSSPRRWTARSGCPRAARWSSTAPRR